MSLSITATISLTIKPVAALTREEVRSKKVPLLVVEASDLRLGVEAGDDVLGPGDGGGGPAARHAGRPAALQLLIIISNSNSSQQLASIVSSLTGNG